MIETEPFWRTDHPRPADLAVSPLPPSTSVLVIGAGFTGLHAARVLAMAGVDVTVVDAGPVGAGASSVNGGMVNSGLKASTQSVFKAYGPEAGRVFWDASLASIDLVEKVTASEGIDCDFHRDGAAELGATKRDLRSFQASSDWFGSNLQHSTQVMSGVEMGGVVGSNQFTSALVDTVGAGLHPAKYAFGLAAVAARRGARIVEDAAVSEIVRSQGRFTVTTAKGQLTADQVILATNGYTGPLVPWVQRRVVPIGSYIVVTEPLPLEVAEGLVPNDRMLWTSRRFLNYFRRTPDNRLLMGGRNDLSTDLDLTESARNLTATIRRFYPQLGDVRITHSWSGRLGVTFDLMPHIGQRDGIWYGLGYGGHGVGIGSYIGAELGRLLSGEIESSPFAEISFPGRIYYRGRPWFLPAAGVLFRLLDRIGR